MTAASLEDMCLKNVALILCAITLLASPGLAAAASPANGGRTVYKWVDEQGITHYGDHIPPEYAAQEQHVMNAQGVEINRPSDLFLSAALSSAKVSDVRVAGSTILVAKGQLFLL